MIETPCTGQTRDCITIINSEECDLVAVDIYLVAAVNESNDYNDYKKKLKIIKIN